MPNNRQQCCKSCPGHISQNPNLCRINQPLSKETNNGNVLLIFQAPGIDEWNTGKPIISENKHSAAARITNSLNRIKKSRKDFDITNAVQCFPGKNSSGRDKPPSVKMRKCCKKWLKSDISSGNYQKIIVFGNCAKQSVEELGYRNDPRFVFLRHPTGCLTNNVLDNALC